MMTIDEAIKHAEEVAEINENIKEEDISLLYCDDTELIENHLNSCKQCAEEHRQLAVWLTDYKQLHEGIDKTIALLEYLKKCKAKDTTINSKVYFEYNTVMHILERIVNG